VFVSLAAPVEEKQSAGFTTWLLGGGGWFTKTDEPLNDMQRKYEDVARKTVKQCKIDALVAGSGYAVVIYFVLWGGTKVGRFVLFC
jgi:hypothetical protein